MDLNAMKAEARRAAFDRRKTAFETLGPDHAGLLVKVLAPHAGKVLAGYMPMRTEISPLAAMTLMAGAGPVCVPVIQGKGLPLRFAQWTPDGAMASGAFGAMVPAVTDWLEPEVLIVPLVGFDRRGGRLGYGGGFYDRTLEALRARGAVLAVGFAFAAQEAGELPLEPTDQPLDLIVTEREVILPDATRR
ncbi:MAG: 5-formyltetrahydrofolate cyclo-ligase [Paracoccaceae bacterium]|uniref:5-formyltetrahydrofolate cyclo-ligase n=1 Tax=Seohaeicola saemankumensis TaxID=481181 RepID=UPI001E38440A|nr:5-formyltetrahydrofolate cyclo-ligase [Seohaeicola saemankumensis]MCD1625509.1 5-formyltetrahydrofolate cyclo-ligase [Seohaeicola saemankumensis]